VTQASHGKSELLVMFGGYGVDEAARKGRREQPAWGYQLRPVIFAPHRDNFETTLMADHAGTSRVRAVLWIVYMPSFGSLAWQPDGTPEHPPNAVWFERREFEATVRVDP
jgi:hypothetical protein